MLNIEIFLMGLCKMLQRTPSSKFAFLSVVFCVTLLLTLFELQILRIENNQENLGELNYISSNNSLFHEIRPLNNELSIHILNFKIEFCV